MSLIIVLTNIDIVISYCNNIVGRKGTNELNFSRVLYLCHTRDTSSPMKLLVRRTVEYRHKKSVVTDT